VFECENNFARNNSVIHTIHSFRHINEHKILLLLKLQLNYQHNCYHYQFMMNIDRNNDLSSMCVFACVCVRTNICVFVCVCVKTYMPFITKTIHIMSAYHKYAYHHTGEKMTFGIKNLSRTKKFRVNERQRKIVLVRINNISRQIVYKIKMTNGTI